MTLQQVLLTNAAAIAALMVAVWLISLPLRNASIVDLIWGAGFVMIAWVTWLNSEGNGPSRWLLPVLTTVWGMRLSVFLAFRNLGHGEDKRYAAMRDRAGDGFALRSLLTVFALQGVVMWIVALPLQAGIVVNGDGWTWLHAAGVAIWLIGLIFEAGGDYQLARFKANPENAGRVMNGGLWRYTRHPNYFGDFMIWWGLYVISIAHGQTLWTIVGPILMSVCLLKISGVALLERSIHETRPGYAEYKQQTNAFFPWFPRRASDA